MDNNFKDKQRVTLFNNYKILAQKVSNLSNIVQNDYTDYPEIVGEWESHIIKVKEEFDTLIEDTKKFYNN